MCGSSANSTWVSTIYDMTWREIKTKIFDYCEGWKALYGDIDPSNISRSTHRNLGLLDHPYIFKKL